MGRTPTTRVHDLVVSRWRGWSRALSGIESMISIQQQLELGLRRAPTSMTRLTHFGRHPEVPTVPVAEPQRQRRDAQSVTSRHVVPVVLYGDRPAATLAALLEFQQVQQRGPDAGAQFGICLRSAAALHRHAFGAWSRLTWQMYPVSGSRAGDDLGVQAVGGSAILHLAGEQDRWPDQVVATGSQQNLTSDALYGDRQPR